MNPNAISQTPLDQLVSTEQSQMLKAAIPYLSPTAQRFLAFYTKFQELSNTIAAFSPQRQNLQMCAAPASHDPLEILQDMQHFCYGESRQKIDQILNVFATMEMVRTFSDMPDMKGES